jgi:hypothetical protein
VALQTVVRLNLNQSKEIENKKNRRLQFLSSPPPFIEQVFLLARVMYKAVLGLHFQRQEQKKNGQLAIF